MHIGVYGKAGGRQDTLGAGDIGGVQAYALGQLHPARDAAGALGVAIMVDDTAAPFAAILHIGQPRHQRRVLDRDHRLIIVAVQRPGLHLRAGELAVVQQPMKRMQAVVTLRPDLP